MKFSRSEFLIFLTGLCSLGGLGALSAAGWRRTSRSAPKSKPALDEKFRNVVHRNGETVFDVDRARRIVFAYNDKTGERIWESSGEEKLIIPGAAFPIDFSPEGELWVGNVGRKRLERLDPETGKFLSFWEPREPFGGCCNPVRFAALSRGRFVTMEKGVRRACVYSPSGELERTICGELSKSEFDYFLSHDAKTVFLYDAGLDRRWTISYAEEPDESTARRGANGPLCASCSFRGTCLLEKKG